DAPRDAREPSAQPPRPLAPRGPRMHQRLLHDVVRARRVVQQRARDRMQKTPMGEQLFEIDRVVSLGHLALGRAIFFRKGVAAGRESIASRFVRRAGRERFTVARPRLVDPVAPRFLSSPSRDPLASMEPTLNAPQPTPAAKPTTFPAKAFSAASATAK